MSVYDEPQGWQRASESVMRYNPAYRWYNRWWTPPEVPWRQWYKRLGDGQVIQKWSLITGGRVIEETDETV